MIIGLTGQTGSGKSTLCDYLKKAGFYICSCDKVAKEVRNDPSFAKKIAKVFGSDIINKNGEIDRKLLAQRAFSCREATEKLNKIMHPEILMRAFECIAYNLENGFEYAVLDAPQLFESGAQEKCDVIVSVIADREKRLERIIKRDGISEDEALKRISVQYDDDFYIGRSDHIIINNDTDALENEAEKLIAKIKGMSDTRT